MSKRNRTKKFEQEQQEKRCDREARIASGRGEDRLGLSIELPPALILPD